MDNIKKLYENTLALELQVLGFFHLYVRDHQDI